MPLPFTPLNLPLPQVLTQGPGYDPSDSSQFRPYHVSLEDLYGALPQYYDMAWLSLRTATWRYAISAPSNDSWSWHSFYDQDNRHPNDLGECRLGCHLRASPASGS